MEVVTDKIFASNIQDEIIPGIAYRAYLTRCGWCNRIHFNHHWIVLSINELDKFQGRYSHAICPKCLEEKFVEKGKRKQS
ncbi:hypothetical protein [Candidatus Lokiarchaeum ossiferum]